MYVRIPWDRIRERHAEILNAGSTFTTAGIPITEGGISVGGKAPAIVLPLDEFTPEFLGGVMQSWSGHPYYVEEMGGWIDNGLVYLDAVDIIGDREVAEDMGRIRGELAIFDLDAGEEIRL